MTNVIPRQVGRIQALWRLPLFRVTGAVSLAFISASIGLPLWRLFPDLYGQVVVPLHYNIHYGVDLTGAWWQIFQIPALGILFAVINTSFALYFVRKNFMITTALLVGTAVLSVMLFAAMVFVVSLNIVYG